jgi:hypothetical protein
MCSMLRAARADGAVAVMVRPRYYLHAKAVLPDQIRCVTHPDELKVLQLDVCVVWGQDDLLATHGQALRSFANVVWLDDTPTLPSRCDGANALSF